MRVAPIQPVQGLPSRLPQRPGVEQVPRHKVKCACGAEFTSTRPQDPELSKDQGTCIDCRTMAAVEWAKKNGKTESEGITRFTRFA